VPIYEYECSACGKSFEIFLGMSDKPVKKCPNCKSSKIRKLVSNCSFQLKGSGWYVTDYARKDNNSGKKKQKKSDTKETGTTAEASDSKKSADSSTSESSATNKAA